MDEQGRRRRLAAGTAIAGLIVGLALGILLSPDPQPVVPTPSTPTPTPTPSTLASQPTSAGAETETDADRTETDADRTEAGAIAAALEWMDRFTPALYLDDEARQLAVSDIAAESAEADLQTITANIADNFRDIGLTPTSAGRALFLGLPAGYEVVNFSEDEAEVLIWLGQVAHVGDVLPLTTSWDTQTTVMEWERGQWRLVSVTSTDGPVPEFAVQGDGELEQTLEVIEAFTEFSHAP